ncbi:unnamed protein product [Arabis nemorensis]|uniref:Uncharacterized protein n=1 Tax=Arabis nemorensis TaxID=586526 RepID=A0A565C499_9BRAS|nr:unnamed protein product [Arabis nemorensis]
MLLFQKKLSQFGCSQAGKNKWVEMGKEVSRKVQHVEEVAFTNRGGTGLYHSYFKNNNELDKESLNSLKARKLIAPQ